MTPRFLLLRFFLCVLMICYWFLKVTDYEVCIWDGLEQNHLPKLLGSLWGAKITWESPGSLNRITRNHRTESHPKPSQGSPHPWHGAWAAIVGFAGCVVSRLWFWRLSEWCSCGQLPHPHTRKGTSVGSVSIAAGATSFKRLTSSCLMLFWNLPPSL